MAKITQFGLYPRFFVKKKDLLYPVIEKYSGQSLQGINQGQVIKTYFNLLRNDVSFRGEIDALIANEGDKLLTIQQKIQQKISNKSTVKEQIEAQKQIASKNQIQKGKQSNFLNATADTDPQSWDEATFIQAISQEEQAEITSNFLKIAGWVALIAGAIYLHKRLKK